MGFLDRLWDETLAGPAPDKGLGKLRKYKSLSAARSPDHPIVTNTTRYQDHDRRDDHDQTVPVSRSITILRTKSLTVEPGFAASSPSSTSSGPSSPFSPAGKSPDMKRRMMRKKPTFEPSEHAEPTSPVYDWIMISALDR
ncbi:dormancy-associated protein homolog 4-like isoform X1 [Chenopodium quinoa]|uniref:dormancy-associated protein homolog 4-like isoform X1 n=1 Tax=Chenopodium quinoa TaxID=63459 RepID=UPI000B79A24C|nr:dormancy-associated protein homolog 4-like isoform X1 [Chenopodium quinoa]